VRELFKSLKKYKFGDNSRMSIPPLLPAWRDNVSFALTSFGSYANYWNLQQVQAGFPIFECETDADGKHLDEFITLLPPATRICMDDTRDLITYYEVITPQHFIAVDRKAGNYLTFEVKTTDRTLFDRIRALFALWKEAGREEVNFWRLIQYDDSYYRLPCKLSAEYLLTEEQMGLLYGESMGRFDQALGQTLLSPNCSLSLLEGLPGTGKTSYIRHLIMKWHDQVDFNIVDASDFNQHERPKLFSLLESHGARGVPQVVIIEDGESLLMYRDQRNAQEVAFMLNMADGLLANLVKVHLLCTINAKTDNLDPAILRPGRLRHYRKFEPLTDSQVEAICARYSLNKPRRDSEVTLAELFNQDTPHAGERIRASVGFGAGRS
jgi:hypothetical protein